ncbi:WD40 repeat domain 95 [Datura stramonium]|uniref:WD40 repeat domain 95 n=1 Tax=Datura stramonium TaxID=4076 RepID=A0ABS8SEQ3_DATST|nr:WD40 repeat domain 95 [Datura stramonium]
MWNKDPNISWTQLGVSLRVARHLSASGPLKLQKNGPKPFCPDEKPGPEPWSPEPSEKPCPEPWAPEPNEKLVPEPWTPDTDEKPGLEPWTPETDEKPGPEPWTPTITCPRIGENRLHQINGDSSIGKFFRLDKYIHDYLVKKGMHETAEAFASEADVGSPTDVANQSPEGYLEDWWDVFYGMFSSNQAKHAQESYAEVARTIDNVAHNVSPVVPAFSAERSQEQCHLRTLEDEVTSNLRSLEIDRPSQRAPFVTDSSHSMEQILNMPQQLEPRDEGEERGIYFEQTLPMEPNSDAHKKAMLLVPDLSEADSSIGSCSGMQQTP